MLSMDAEPIVLPYLVMLDTVTMILLARPLSKTVAVVAISMFSSDETCIVNAKPSIIHTLAFEQCSIFNAMP